MYPFVNESMQLPRQIKNKMMKYVLTETTKRCSGFHVLHFRILKEVRMKNIRIK